MATTYIVRAVTYAPDNSRQSEIVRTVQATSPEEAMTMVERTGIDYYEAEVSDEHGNQLAVYGANLWRDDWEHEDDAMWTCPTCGNEMLHWQQTDHRCANA